MQDKPPEDGLHLFIGPETEKAVMETARELGIGPEDVVGHAIATLLYVKDAIARGDRFFRLPAGTQTPRPVLFMFLLQRFRPSSLASSPLEQDD